MTQVQSADGLVHDFPDGTNPAVIDRVMKSYAAQKRPAEPAAAPEPAPDASVADPVYDALPPRKPVYGDEPTGIWPGEHAAPAPPAPPIEHPTAPWQATPTETQPDQTAMDAAFPLPSRSPAARAAIRGYEAAPQLPEETRQWLRDKGVPELVISHINSPLYMLALANAAMQGGQAAIADVLKPVLGEQGARDMAAMPEAILPGFHGMPRAPRLTPAERVAMSEARGWSEAPVTFAPPPATDPRAAATAWQEHWPQYEPNPTKALPAPEERAGRPMNPEQAAMDEEAAAGRAQPASTPSVEPTAPREASAAPEVVKPEPTTETPQPIPEPTQPSAVTTPSGAYVMVDPEQLRVAPEIFQYKQSGDGGVTGALHGVDRWEPGLANPITAWQATDGTLYVVNGHQRTDLALRAKVAGQPDVQMPARVYREADGYTPEYMKFLGAYQNMAEGSGTAVDAAKVLRSAGAFPEDRRLPDLPPRGQIVQQASALAKLSPEAFGVIENGIVPPGYAAHVGNLIADPTEQMAALDMLARAQPANSEQARLMVRDIRDSGFLRGSQTTLFGDEDFARSLVPERARVLENALRNLRRVKGVFRAAVEGEDSLTAAGNALNREGNIQGRTENEQLLDRLQHDATTRGPISDALTAAASELAGGKPPAGVVSRFLVEARRLVRSGQDQGIRSGDLSGGEGYASEGDLENGALFSRRGPVPPQAGPDLFGSERQPTTRRAAEPTIRTDARQAIMPGMEPSAVQAQAARDAQGPRGNQQPADQGLFAPKEGEQSGLPDLSRRGAIGGNGPLRAAAVRANNGIIRRGAQAMINRLRMQSNLDAAANRRDRLGGRSRIDPNDIREIEDFINFIGHEMFSDVGLRIMQDGDGANGAFQTGRNIVYLFRKAIDDGSVPHTMVHELWHSLERVLPREDRVALTQEFNRQREAWLKKNPWAEPFLDNGELRDQLTGQQARDWIEQHTEARDGQRWIDDRKIYDAVRVEGIQSPSPTVRMVWTHDNYRFKNRSEYFAETMTDRRFDDQDIHDAKARSVFAHIRDIWRRFVAGVQRLFGRDATGRIYEGFRNREYAPGVDRGLMSGSDYAESRATDLIKKAAKRGRDLAKTIMERPRPAAARDIITEFLAPMRLGPGEPAEQAFRFANKIRLGQTQFGRMAEHIRDTQTIAQRWEIGRAQAEQSVFERKLARELEAQPPANRAAFETAARARFDATGAGHAGLGPKGQVLVKTLSAMADKTWSDLQAREMVDPKAEGWAHWMPRQLVIMEPGKTARRIVKDDSILPNPTGGKGNAPDIHPFGTNMRTDATGFRDYEEVQATLDAARKKYGPNVHLVNDIMSVLSGLERANKAIAGHDLLQGIKSYGARTGTVMAYEGGARPGFTVAGNPAMWKWQPVFVDDAAGKRVMATDPNGQPMFEKTPVWVHEDFRGPIEAVFRAPPGGIMRAYMAVKALSTHFVMQSPLTHLQVELGRAMPLLAGRTPVVMTLGAGRRARMAADPRIDELIRHGMAPIVRGFIGDPVSLMNEANYKAPFGPLGEAIVTARDALARGAGKLPGGELWEKIIRRPIQTMLWNRVLDLQTAIGLGMAEDRIKAGWDPTAAYTAAAHLANRYAGALPPEGMSRLMNTLANVALFSRSFTGGNLGVMKDTMTGAPKHILDHIGYTDGPGAQAAAKDWLKNKSRWTFFADIILYYGLTAAIQHAATALYQSLGLIEPEESISDGYIRRFHQAMQYVGDHPIKSLFVPNVIAELMPTADNEPGKEDRSRLWPLDGSSQYLYFRSPVGKVGEEFLSWLTDPFGTLTRKQSTISKGTQETVSGKDNFSLDIRRPGRDDALANIGRSTLHLAEALFPIQLEKDVYTAMGRPGSSLWGAPPPTGKERMLAGLQAAGAASGLGSFSRGFPSGPLGALESVKERQIKFDTARVMPEVRRLAEAGRTTEAEQKLVKAGEDPKRAARFVASLNPADAADFQQKRAGQIEKKMGHRDDHEMLDRAEILRRSYGLPRSATQPPP